MVALHQVHEEWDAINSGNAVWAWSGFSGYGGSATQWPDGSTVALRTWDAILTAFPNAKMRISDSWFGMRVDDNSAANTQHVDEFIFGVSSTSITYDFEPQP